MVMVPDLAGPKPETAELLTGLAENLAEVNSDSGANAGLILKIRKKDHHEREKKELSK